MYLQRRVADAALRQLESQKQAIHQEMGIELVWNPYPEKQDNIILADRPAELGKRDQWPEYLEWMTETLLRFRKAFRERVKALDLTGSPSDQLEK